MTEQETVARLRAALQSRAELVMSSTETSQQLDRLRGAMKPARRHRRWAMVSAAAAGLLIVGGGAGLGVAMTGDDHTRSVGPAQTPTPQATTTAPADFPVGDYARPGAATRTELQLGDSKAMVRYGNDRLVGLMSFPAPGQVQFDCYQDEITPCLSRCLYEYKVSGPTLEFVRVHENSVCRSDDLLSSGPWQRSP